MKINSMDDFDLVNCCCGMPSCAAPVKECQSKTGSSYFWGKAMDIYTGDADILPCRRYIKSLSAITTWSSTQVYREPAYPSGTRIDSTHEASGSSSETRTWTGETYCEKMDRTGGETTSSVYNNYREETWSSVASGTEGFDDCDSTNYSTGSRSTTVSYSNPTESDTSVSAYNPPTYYTPQEWNGFVGTYSLEIDEVTDEYGSTNVGSYSSTVTLGEEDTEFIVGERAIEAAGEEWTGDECQSVMYRQCGITGKHDRITATKARYRFGVPENFSTEEVPRSVYELQWDEVTASAEWWEWFNDGMEGTEPSPSAVLVEKEWVWGGDMEHPWSPWYEIPLPDTAIISGQELEQRTEPLNLIVTCYRASRIGSTPTAHGPSYNPPPET